MAIAVLVSVVTSMVAVATLMMLMDTYTQALVAVMVACSWTVIQTYSYMVLNCHMVEGVVVAVVPASRSTVLKNARLQSGSWCVRPAAEAVGVALRNTQEAENPQARLGVMAVGEWVTLGQTAHMRSQSDSWCVRPVAEVVGVAR